MNNGQVNASARFIRLFIGEPGRFALPLSIYSGVSANNFQNPGGAAGPRNNEHLVNQFINPLSGLINLSAEGVLYFKQTERLSKAGWLYHLGGRVLTGYQTGPATSLQTGKPVNFLNGFATLGLYVQTGAWERSNAKNTGVFWLAMQGHICHSNPAQLKEFLPGLETNGVYTGYSAGFGIDINGLINLKAIYYKYIKNPEPGYGLPIYQFSFNYTMKN
jgi:hypothetical protein